MSGGCTAAWSWYRRRASGGMRVVGGVPVRCMVCARATFSLFSLLALLVVPTASFPPAPSPFSSPSSRGSWCHLFYLLWLLCLVALPPCLFALCSQPPPRCGAG